jgi:glycosyltransferase involved in cell wall biosynthesis
MRLAGIRPDMGAPTMKVLYIDAVGPFGGASRSLFEMVRRLAAVSVEPYFVMQKGTAQAYYGRVAKSIITTRGLTRFDNTRATHYRGVRWLVVLRELYHFPFTVFALVRANRRWGKVDLIHVNELVDIVPGLVAKLLFRAPLLVHVRSLQWTNPGAQRTRWINRILRRQADAIVAIDENTRATLPADLPVDVIHNSFTAGDEGRSDERLPRALESLRPGSLKAGFVGNLHVSKGLFDLLEAARLLHRQGADVEFLIVGGVTMDDRGIKARLIRMLGLAQNIESDVRLFIQANQLGSVVHMLGHTSDIRAVYRRMDVLLFPSYFDAPGRPVFEAAFFGVPSIACVSQPREDTLIPGETGLTVPAGDPAALAAAIGHFERNRAEITRMGDNARRLAKANFEPGLNAEKLLAVYRRVLSAVVHR